MEAINCHIKSAVVINLQSKLHGTKQDIIIENGVIKQVGENLESDHTVISSPNLHVSIGWMDLMSRFCDPGMEHKETVQSGLKAARAGGFTEVCVAPVTQPVVDSKSGVNYLKGQALNQGVRLHPIGTLSVGMKGENISEMYDMQQAGAVAFGDDKQSVSAGVLTRALLYAKNFDGTIFSFPHDSSFGDGFVNEGISSTKTGLKSVPALAEEIQIERDLALANYNETGVHFTLVSSGRSVELIRQAKAKGQRITCAVSVMHLLFNETDTETFDSHFKLMPPLRTLEDQKLLWDGLKDGTIDAIVSDHTPEDPESKVVEFDHAAFGVTSLETLYASLNKTENWSTDLLHKALVEGPRQVLGMTLPELSVGAKANLTLFDPEIKWTYHKTESLSKNTPFLGKELTGKVITTVLA